MRRGRDNPVARIERQRNAGTTAQFARSSPSFAAGLQLAQLQLGSRWTKERSPKERSSSPSLQYAVEVLSSRAVKRSCRISSSFSWQRCCHRPASISKRHSETCLHFSEGPP